MRAFQFNIYAVFLITAPSQPHTGFACSSIGVGAAIGGFVGGVLLTATTAVVVAVAVFYRIKRELIKRAMSTAKM